MATYLTALDLYNFAFCMNYLQKIIKITNIYEFEFEFRALYRSNIPFTHKRDLDFDYMCHHNSFQISLWSFVKRQQLLLPLYQVFYIKKIYIFLHFICLLKLCAYTHSHTQFSFCKIHWPFFCQWCRNFRQW